MSKHTKTVIRQVAVLVVSIVVAFTILVRTELVSRLAYLIEKGRIQAVREAMPSAAELDHWNEHGRMVAAAVGPGVVQIITEQTVKFSARTNSDVLRDLFGLDGDASSNGADVATNGPAMPDDALHRAVEPDGAQQVTGYGSGFIADSAAGYVVTNYHVIAGAEVIRVYLADGRRFKAELLGADPKTDLAALRIPAENLHALPMVDSGSVAVGDEVMAVGNPFGFDGSFSRGIISAMGRSNVSIKGVEYEGFIQTDAVINPGNSGGPLVNMRGEVIAINTAIATESGNFGGVGFAIPSRRIIQLLPTLAQGHLPERGFLGVRIMSVSNEEALSRSLGWDQPYGVIVSDVQPDTPAAAGGLREGDIILTINDCRLRTTADLINIVGETAPYSELELRIHRDKKEQSLALRVGRQPENFSTRPRIPILPIPQE